MKVAVIGAGGWGTALSILLARKGLEIILHEHFLEYGKVLSRKRENVQFLPGFALPEGITITTNLATTTNADFFILAPPSFAFRSVARRVKETGIKGPFLIATKGLEENGCRMSQVLTAELGLVSFAVLSGPNIAREVAAGLPAGSVCAGPQPEVCVLFQQMLATDRFRVYTSDDYTGVELAGALKNPLAIAAGIAEGLGLGENSRAILLCRGLAEAARLGVALGGQQKTFFGLSGLGDLLTTAASPHSRNHRFGLALSQGKAAADLIQESTAVVEGYHTVRPALRLAAENEVEMPITQAVAAVIFEGKPAAKAVTELMTRPLKEE